MIDKTPEFYDFLVQFITEERVAHFDKVLDQRTRHITVAIEDIYQPHNASAVLRSCDCFGIQDVHIIENRNPYKINPEVALGSGKWLTMKKHNELKNNSKACIDHLKAQGYTIVATPPHTDDVLLDQLPLDKPVALIFGTEGAGISNIVRENADAFMRIPMYGFTESFNISVSAAVCLNVLSSKIREQDIDWHLNDEERLALKIEWAKAHLGNTEGYIKEYKRRMLS
jgi:tRNA (guanosine-2'-O-)-methyltransferase